MKVGNDFSYTIDEVINTAKENNADYALLINPENPSGHFFTKEEVCDLAGKLLSLNKKLILDESFVDFAF